MRADEAIEILQKLSPDTNVLLTISNPKADLPDNALKDERSQEFIKQLDKIFSRED